MKQIIKANSGDRLRWLDTAKGVAILGVVIGHSANYIFHTQGGFMDRVIDSYYLTLFFLCSGFVSLKLFSRTKDTAKFLIAKDFSLLIPFFVCGLIYASIPDICSMRFYEGGGKCLTRLFNPNGHYGYWFFLVLFLFRVAVIITQYFTTIIFRWLHKEDKNDNYHFYLTLVCSTGLAFLFVCTLSNWAYAVRYWPFYVIGVYIKKYNIIEKFSTHTKEITFFALCAIILMILSYMNLGQFDFINKIIKMLVLPFFSTLVMFAVSVLTGGNKHLSYLGLKSLDIYCIHYFLFFGFASFLPENSIASFPWALQTIIFTITGLVLAYSSILISRAIHIVPHLSKFVFGR